MYYVKYTSFFPSGIKTCNKSGVKYFSNGIHENISENTFVTPSYISSELEVLWAFLIISKKLFLIN